MRFKISLLIGFFSLLFLLDRVSSYTEFEISVPTHVQNGLYGESMILFCTFPVDSSWDLYSSVITWQRHLEVIHSFYYGQDQLQHQSHRYRNRTSLFYQELKNGNASLRLDHINLEDAGEYTCSISTQLGSQKKSFKMNVAAFYPEPQLHISLLNKGHVEVLVTSEGGYPSPSLQWLMENEDDVTNNTHTQLRQDKDTQLYSVNSKLNLTVPVNISITFILKNEELGQEMRRNIDLFAQYGDLNKNEQSLIICLCLLGFIALTAVIFSVMLYRKQQMKKKQKYLSVDDGLGLRTQKTDCGVAA
ncbi:CD276 antigen [Trichomycterus rosablanca]|uniref:CD276 antigen n=1 Tax=Trichomycterus rosablanca TaxID=2290929 RepID=UPI002F35DB27